MKVREILKIIQDDGWYLARTKGSHHQFKHPVKKDLVTVSGGNDDDLHPKTLKSIKQQAGLI
ncbi:MAG: type II toxin-antitoxin system HicA family toxin [Desulfamplus sp.]|nr:type II toxin-antitoxin system HicA family toxin [Desulfamplus sp.]